MPRKYKRKDNVAPRAEWTEETLVASSVMIKAGSMGINQASKFYNIPSRTLRRRLKNNNFLKGHLGKPPALGFTNEKRLVKHIQRLEAAGFAPTRQTVRQIAFEFAKKLGVEDKLLTKNSKENKTSAGSHCRLYSFLERNPELSIRQSEGLSLSRAKGMCRAEVDSFFALLKETLETNDLIDKPGSIYNMDESGIQINNKPGKVLATKGSKDVHVLTSVEKGENVTVITCANAEGTFLPPVLVMKGVRKNLDYLDGLPAGADLYMNRQSSYINSDLFLKWFKEHFLVRKGSGKALLIMDGHTSHCSFEMLQVADQNNVVILCLPSHTTQALQPLDRSFFKPLKEYFKQAAQDFMFHNTERKITRFKVGHLIGEAWKKAATVGNGTAGFEATGIYPLRPNAIPDYFFKISDTATHNVSTRDNEIQNEENANTTDSPNLTVEQRINEDEVDAVILNPSVNINDLPNDFFENLDNYITISSGTDNKILDITNIVLNENDEIQSEFINHAHIQAQEQPTPSKYLHDISPVPTIPVKRGRFHTRKQSAEVLTSQECLKKKAEDKAKKGKQTTKSTATKKSSTLIQKFENFPEPSTSISKHTTTSNNQNEDDVDCAECLENYLLTKDNVDWIQCVECKSWIHESCTMYDARCNSCGRSNKRKLVAKRKLC